MSKAKARKHVEEYESDDGFIEDAPKSKKQKVKKEVGGQALKDEEGNEYWEISGKRRLQVSEFKGNTFVGIREFYEKDGKSLPGKKGISLSIEQYTAFIDLLPEIERVLKSKSITVPRPSYDKKAGSPGVKEEEEAAASEDDEAEVASSRTGKLDKFKMRKNHDATSDEDDD